MHKNTLKMFKVGFLCGWGLGSDTIGIKLCFVLECPYGNPLGTPSRIFAETPSGILSDALNGNLARVLFLQDYFMEFLIILFNEILI